MGQKGHFTIVGHAITLKNIELLKALVELGIDFNDKIECRLETMAGQYVYQDTPLNWAKEEAKKDKSYEELVMFIEKIAPNSATAEAVKHTTPADDIVAMDNFKTKLVEC